MTLHAQPVAARAVRGTTMRSEPSDAERTLFWVLAGIVGYEFGVTRDDLVSERRHAHFVRARAFVTWALRHAVMPRSYPAIGRMLGGRDHATIINLHRKAIRLRLEDAKFKAACDRVAQRLATMEGQS